MAQSAHLVALADVAGAISDLAVRAEASFAEATAATRRPADSPDELERRRALIDRLAQQLVCSRLIAEKTVCHLEIVQSIGDAQAISVDVCEKAARRAERAALVAQTAVQTAQGALNAVLAARAAQGAAATQAEAAAPELAARAAAAVVTEGASAAAANADEIPGRSISPEPAPQTEEAPEDARRGSPRRRGRSVETASSRSARSKTSASGSRTPARPNLADTAEPAASAAASASHSQLGAAAAAATAAAAAAETGEPIWHDVPRPSGFKISVHGVPNAWGMNDFAAWLERCKCVPIHTCVTFSGHRNARRFALTFGERSLAKFAKRRLDRVKMGSCSTRAFYWSDASA